MNSAALRLFVLTTTVTVASVGCSTPREPQSIAPANPASKTAQPAPATRADKAMTAVLEAHAKLQPKPIESLTPQEARLQPSPADAVLQLLQDKGEVSPQPEPSVGKVETRTIARRSGGDIPVRVYTPHGEGPFPVIVYYHGGGWVLGTLDTYDASCRALCDSTGAVVVSVDYRLAPEHTFPAAHEDAYEALQHVLSNAQEFGGDSTKVAVAGESAGGNLATAVCLMARQRSGRMPIHQLLVYPVTSTAMDTESYREHARAKPLNAAMMAWFFGHYLPGKSDRENVLVSPLDAGETDLRALPPATIITAEIDPLRSEGRAYADRLKGAGVPVEVRDFQGVVHEFFGMAAVVPKAVEAQEFAAAGLRRAFDATNARTPAVKTPRPSKPSRTTRTAAATRISMGATATAEADRLAVVEQGPAKGKRQAGLEVVALISGSAMPTGVAVSKAGRIFLSFPRWGDPVEHTAVELRDGELVPFPDAETNRFDPDVRPPQDPAAHLVSVQSVFVDAKDRLWLLDPGSIQLGPVIDGAPKLWCYDLASGQRIHDIRFPRDVALKKTYLNDVRVDLERGPQGTAYITDSGAGGIIVVDLASGQSWRHLDGHPAVKPTPGAEFTSEGEPFVLRKPTREEAAPDIRSDGIALSPDGETLYFTPLMSRDIQAVPAALLADRKTEAAKLAAAVRRVATKPSASDGIWCDGEGRLWSADWEDNALRRIDAATGQSEVVAQDERMLWPDTLAMHDGHLYVASNQLARQPNYHFGEDERVPPYVLFRMRVQGGTATPESR